jgi:hypothetical protein
MVSVSAQAVTGMRNEETEKGVCYFHDTDTCASIVGVYCSTPTSVKHNNQYTHTQESLLTLVCRVHLSGWQVQNEHCGMFG